MSDMPYIVEGVDTVLPRILCGRYLVACDRLRQQGDIDGAARALDQAVTYMKSYSVTEALQNNRSHRTFLLLSGVKMQGDVGQP